MGVSCMSCTYTVLDNSSLFNALVFTFALKLLTHNNVLQLLTKEAIDI